MFITLCSHVVVALKITEKLIAECSPQRLQLIVDSYLDMLHAMLESTHNDMQIMATNSVSLHIWDDVIEMFTLHNLI